MKIIGWLFLVLALAGCESTRYRTVTVEVPVPVPCTTKPIQKPEWALEALSDSATFFERVRAALVEIEQRSAYEARLEAALTACN